MATYKCVSMVFESYVGWELIQATLNEKIKVIGIVCNDHNDHIGGVSHHEQKFSAIVWGRRQ